MGIWAIVCVQKPSHHWSCSSLISTPPADSRCETCERIVLLFLFVS